MKRWNRKIAPIFIEKFVKNQKFFSYWCQSREGARRTMTFSELVISLTLLTFSKCFSWWCWRGLLAFLCEEGELTSQNVKVLSCFTENPFYIPYIWDFHWKPPGPGFEKSGMSSEIFAPSLFQSYCQSLALQAQTRRGTSPSRTSVLPSPLDGRAPPNVQSSCLLCWLLSRKSLPSPLSAVAVKSTGGVDLPHGCQSWHRQYQQGDWVAFGGVIFPPAHVLGFPPSVVIQWQASSSRKQVSYSPADSSSKWWEWARSVFLGPAWTHLWR